MVAVELVDHIGDAADAATVSREVGEDGGPHVLVLLQHAYEEVSRVLHPDLTGLHVPR